MNNHSKCCIDPTPIEQVGNLISVTVVFAEEVAGSATKSRTKVKKVTRTKSDHVNIIDLDRLGFLGACLTIQDLDGLYDFTLPRGPEYWFWPKRHPYVLAFIYFICCYPCLIP